MKTKKLIGGVAVITNKGKHLLIKQSKHKPLCGYWRHPGGKFNNGESWENGLKREIKEELGINLIEINENPIMITKSNYDPGYFGFFQGKINNKIININKEEVEEFGWFTIKEIKKIKLMKATKKFYNQLTK